MQNTRGTDGTPAYHALAPVYDRVMSHVEYDEWLELIKRIIKKHIRKKNPSIFEVGGGTGSLGEMLIQNGYRYFGSDLNRNMCKEARLKNLPVFCADCRAIPLKKPFDLIIFLYDGINYLLSIDDYRILFDQVYQSLSPGGCFLFDITTETNSVRHFFEYLDFEEYDVYSLVRHSYFEQNDSLQFNDFTIFKRVRNNPPLYEKLSERHVQKILPPRIIEKNIPENKFKILGIWDGFTERKYSIRSERIHFLLKKTASS